MLLPRIFAPARASSQAPSLASGAPIRVLNILRLANGSTAPAPSISFVRHATHQAQGRANGAKDGPGKRLGAKKAGGEYVIPGNIIFRQRGTGWFPGENCKFGRDHCVFATEAGYVRYYRDPFKHPKRQYIGVVLKKEDTLPYPRNAARRRRLNMLPVKMETQPEAPVVVNDLQAIGGTGSTSVHTAPQVPASERNFSMGRGYVFREANWDIGRAAERANVQVQKFVPGDRWTAWRKSQARKQANIERKKLRNASKKAKPAKARAKERRRA